MHYSVHAQQIQPGCCLWLVGAKVHEAEGLHDSAGGRLRAEPSRVE